MTYTREEIRIFIKQGYAKSSAILLYNLRNNPEFQKMNVRSFIVGTGNRSQGSIKYSGKDMFGYNCTYYFDSERKENFSDFLVKKFYEKNPSPERGLRKAFTRLLHLNKLHWSEEYTGKKKKTIICEIKENMDVVKNGNV